MVATSQGPLAMWDGGDLIETEQSYKLKELKRMLSAKNFVTPPTSKLDSGDPRYGWGPRMEGASSVSKATKN